jgi:hypothetical protein
MTLRNAWCSDEDISINLNGENYVYIMLYSPFACKSETVVLKANNRYKLPLRIKAIVHEVSFTSLNFIMTA